jgi:hypothetical protein
MVEERGGLGHCCVKGDDPDDDLGQRFPQRITSGRCCNSPFERQDPERTQRPVFAERMVEVDALDLGYSRRAPLNSSRLTLQVLVQPFLASL